MAGRLEKKARIEQLEHRQLLAITAAGSEFLVNTTTAGDQFAPATASDSNGNFIVVWDNQNQVFAQRFSAAGAAISNEFEVNVNTSGVQAQPAVAMDLSGDFVVVWQSNEDVFARPFNSSGTPLDANEFQVNTFTSGNQESPRVAMDGSGNFTIVWDSQNEDGSDYGVYGRQFAANGTAQTGEFLINQTTTNLQADPSIAMDSSGAFVVAWESGDLSAPTFYDIYARRYNSAAVAQGGEFLVNTDTTDFQDFPAAAMDSSGNFVIAWNSFGEDGSGEGVYAQRYNAFGVAQDGEFRVNTATSGDQDQVTIGMGAAGNFTVAWTSENQDGSGGGIYAQNFNSSGATIGSEYRVNTTTANDQIRPAIAFDSGGDFVVAWQGEDQVAADSGYDIFAQRFVAVPKVVSGNFNYLTQQSMTVQFNDDVSGSLTLSSFDVEQTIGNTQTKIANGAMHLNYNTTTNTATITFTSILPNANYSATVLGSTITDAGGNQISGNFTFSDFYLAGDANHDRKVDVTDLGILATNWQQSGKSFAQGDFNYDGTVDVTDLGILASNWQTTLAAAPPAPVPNLFVTATSSAPPARRPVRVVSDVVS